MPALFWVVASCLLLLAFAAILLIWLVPPRLEKSFNKLVAPPPYQARTDARDLHSRLAVVDLHADSLLWKRDLLKQAEYGHVDLPRLVEGSVALQVFAAVTKFPRGVNFERNRADSDVITLLTLAQAWPPRTWRSLLQRALYQAQRLERFASRSQGRLITVRSTAELQNLLLRREAEPELVGGLLAIEGAHALQGDLANLDLLFEAGYRMLGLTHFFDNEAGGSAHGTGRGGLTPFGHELAARGQEKAMVLDLAHASPQVIDDVLKLASGPLVVSHTGVCGTHDSPRNLSDEHLRGIAATGGVMGITMFDSAVGGRTLDDTARAMRYTADLVGVDHVALGSDFDGAVTAPVDASGLALLTEALLGQGFAEGEIKAIMGGNALRVLAGVLPVS
jgi:microsomal dipeptidase-like Zn-dependent dipeptidase